MQRSFSSSEHRQPPQVTCSSWSLCLLVLHCGSDTGQAGLAILAQHPGLSIAGVSLSRVSTSKTSPEKPRVEVPGTRPTEAVLFISPTKLEQLPYPVIAGQVPPLPDQVW